MDDLEGDFALRAYRVQNDNGSLEIEKVQKLGDRRDFVTFFVYCLLGGGETIVLSSRTHNLNGALIGLATPSQGFAVDVDQTTFETGSQSGDIGDETFPEDRRINHGKETEKGVGEWNSFGQGDPLFKPLFPRLGIAHKVLASVYPTDDGRECDENQ